MWEKNDFVLILFRVSYRANLATLIGSISAFELKIEVGLAGNARVVSNATVRSVGPFKIRKLLRCKRKMRNLAS